MATLPPGTVKNGLATTVGTYNPADFKDAPAGSYEAQLYQQSLGQNLGQSTGASNPGAGIVSSSDRVVAGENATKNTVAGLTAPDPNGEAVKAASDAYIKLLQDQQAQLETRRQADLTGIGLQFDEAKRQAGIQQEKEKATTATALQRMGGYLGGSVSAVGALNNLAQTHQQEISALEAKKASAIQTANNAINEKQFALAQAMAKEAKDVAVEIADRRDKFFAQSLQLVQEQRQQDEFQKTQFEDKLKNLSIIDPANIDEQSLAEIDDFYGIKGFAKNYLEVTKKANEAKSQKELAEARKSTLEFLQNIPAGQKITMPDGTQFTGIGKAGDVSTFLQVDGSGIGHVITVNKLTGAKSVSNVGVVGKASGSGGAGTTLGKTSPVVIDNATNIVQTKLESTKDKNGNYDPDVYIQERNLIKTSDNPQLVPYMDKLFLDKNNQFFTDAAIKKLRSKGIYFGDTSLPGTEFDGTEVDNTSITEGD